MLPAPRRLRQSWRQLRFQPRLAYWRYRLATTDFGTGLGHSTWMLHGLTRSLRPETCVEIGSARSAGLTGRIELKPRFDLTAAERAAGAARATNHILIQSSNQHAHMPSANKNWPLDRWQAVVDRLAALHPIAQIGSSSDPLLRGVADWRGCSLRTTASLLSAARLCLGGEGAVMHLARAVDCRAVIVLGGRTKPEQTCYPECTNLDTSMSCPPCWQFNACDSQRACLLASTPDEVVSAARTQLGLAPLTGPGKFVAL